MQSKILQNEHIKKEEKKIAICRNLREFTG